SPDRGRALQQRPDLPEPALARRPWDGAGRAPGAGGQPGSTAVPDHPRGTARVPEVAALAAGAVASGARRRGGEARLPRAARSASAGRLPRAAAPPASAAPHRAAASACEERRYPDRRGVAVGAVGGGAALP